MLIYKNLTIDHTTCIAISFVALSILLSIHILFYDNLQTWTDLQYVELWDMVAPTEIAIKLTAIESGYQSGRDELLFAPTLPIVPAVAQTISTPLDLFAWCYFLQGHPDRNLVCFFLHRVSEYLRVGFNYQHCTLKSARRNLACATSYPSVVNDYLKTEVKLSRVAGP